MGSRRLGKNLSEALFGKGRREVLALFFTNPGRSFYLAEIVRRIGSGHGTVQRELKRLSDSGILTRSRRGRQVYYQANPKCPVFAELKGLMLKTAGLGEAVRDALSAISGSIDLAFIYGSQASGAINGASDVDVLVVGKVDDLVLLRALSKAEQKIGRSINYTRLTASEFSKRRKQKGGFISRVLSGPKIYLIGDPDAL